MSLCHKGSPWKNYSCHTSLHRKHELQHSIQNCISWFSADITFAENNEYAILCLKRSKTDINYQGVEIMLTAANNSLCSVQALRRLVTEDSQPPDAPLFSNKGGYFTRKSVINTLHCWLKDCDIASAEYSGHSFCKEAAQHASDNGMLEEQIKTLSHWSLNAFCLYYESFITTLYALNKHFQTGQSLIIVSQTPSLSTVNSLVS